MIEAVPPTLRDPRWRGQLAATAAGLALLVLSTTPAAAQRLQGSLYETDRVVNGTVDECAGLRSSECRTVRSKRRAISANRAVRPAICCPANFPYVVGWDTRHNEHISVTLISDVPRRGLRPGAGEPRQTLSVFALNNANVCGFITLFVGCSNKPFNGAGFARHSSGVPSDDITTAQRRVP